MRTHPPARKCVADFAGSQLLFVDEAACGGGEAAVDVDADILDCVKFNNIARLDASNFIGDMQFALHTDFGSEGEGDEERGNEWSAFDLAASRDGCNFGL